MPQDTPTSSNLPTAPSPSPVFVPAHRTHPVSGSRHDAYRAAAGLGTGTDDAFRTQVLMRLVDAEIEAQVQDRLAPLTTELARLHATTPPGAVTINSAEDWDEQCGNVEGLSWLWADGQAWVCWCTDAGDWYAVRPACEEDPQGTTVVGPTPLDSIAFPWLLLPTEPASLAVAPLDRG